jgi:outer membrane biosynthesis protein TonB
MADHIRNVVRDAFPQVNACYASGLKKNKDLAGRVTVKFLIGPKGTVQRSSDGGSDLADRTVVQCVVSAMKSLVFPSGASVVTVVYPFMFGP